MFTLYMPLIEANKPSFLLFGPMTRNPQFMSPNIESIYMEMLVRMHACKGNGSPWLHCNSITKMKLGSYQKKANGRFDEEALSKPMLGRGREGDGEPKILLQLHV